LFVGIAPGGIRLEVGGLRETSLEDGGMRLEITKIEADILKVIL
jgi:hypothetical protein